MLPGLSGWLVNPDDGHVRAFHLDWAGYYQRINYIPSKPSIKNISTCFPENTISGLAGR
jgi:hypothetical protein